MITGFIPSHRYVPSFPLRIRVSIATARRFHFANSRFRPVIFFHEKLPCGIRNHDIDPDDYAVYCRTTGDAAYFFLILFFLIHIPFIILGFLSRSLSVVTQIRGHIAGSFLPPPHHGTCLHFYRENNSAFSYLIDSRLELFLPTRGAFASFVPHIVYQTKYQICFTL